MGEFLHIHKLARPETYQKWLELFAKALEFRSSDALTQAKSRLDPTRARQLRALQTQLDDYRQQIEKLCACALRCLGQRWLKILWKMWQTRTCYDAELHQKNQLRHGSWVLKLQNA